MSIFLFKSLLSVVLLLSGLVALFTMFEIYGRTEKKYNVNRLQKIHRVNGVFFLLLFAIISFFCLRFLLDIKSDLSPRSALHMVIALAFFILLCFKIFVASIYKGSYGKLPTAGLWVALLTFVLFGTSGGYYLLAEAQAREDLHQVLRRLPDLSGVKGELLFCARGKSSFPKRKAGCNCGLCDIWNKYDLTDFYYCRQGPAE